MFDAALSGVLLGLSLIVAIGAQNAFVLRQGLRREHVGATVAVCALSDAALIVLGIAGFGAAVQLLPWLGPAMRWAGAAFLILYGALRFRAALRGGESLRPAEASPEPLSRTLVTILLLTWANPHVWLDTVVLLGSLSDRHAPFQAAFGAGAAMASVLFFAALGYGARLLAPLFARPQAWVVLELLVGATMWAIAAGLILG